MFLLTLRSCKIAVGLNILGDLLNYTGSRRYTETQNKIGQISRRKAISRWRLEEERLDVQKAQESRIARPGRQRGLSPCLPREVIVL
ncbi:hypothetical protein AGOR_G00075850 [Albula goreensis]|uniref:Uncharacterized protein n=1 Tax=Albula goreensis TaxID=1534307 RepID=A0A8T3DS88_9TELE|nr:hypothetical protein AGOR_G00075850 [Albula goreensis]